jgi:hypothetical protein
MTAVPLPRTWVAGEVLTASNFNTYLTGVLSYLEYPPYCEAYETSNQTFGTSGTNFATTFSLEVTDNTGMHSTVTNTSRFTAVYPGFYLAGGQTSFAANGTGNRASRLAVNGVVGADGVILTAAAAANAMSVPVSARSYFLNTGDYLEVYSWQTSTASLTSGGATINPCLSALWISTGP